MKEILRTMLDLAFQGGKLSLKIVNNSRPTLKPDHSVLTRGDMAVAKLVRTRLKKFLETGEHALIDEEDKKSGGYLKGEALKKAHYLWVVDPIDGTRNYSNRIPLYGISIGVLKDLKPWLGAVYLPVLDELFYCDGKHSYYVSRATSSRPVKKKILSRDMVITRQSIFFGSDAFFKTFEWDFSLCQIMLPSCAVVDLCWPAIGRAAGCFFNAHIWDFAGSWPIFKAAGLELRELQTGKILERIDVNDFQGPGIRTWRLKGFYVLSSKRNFPILKRAMRLK